MNYIKPEDIKAYVEQHPEGIAGMSQELAAMVNHFAKFAVQECMRMCETTEMGFETHGCSVEASGAITVKQYIAEHFGID